MPDNETKPSKVKTWGSIGDPVHSFRTNRPFHLVAGTYDRVEVVEPKNVYGTTLAALSAVIGGSGVIVTPWVIPGFKSKSLLIPWSNVEHVEGPQED
jgi:hypothetical protein